MSASEIATAHPCWPAEVVAVAERYYRDDAAHWPWLVSILGPRWAREVADYR